MLLIQEIMGLGRAYEEFNPEWQRRKSWFDEKVATERLERLHKFYSLNHNHILETLVTGIPFYEQWSQKSPAKTM